MNLNRIELGVLESNTRALKLYEKVEFNREGVKRQSIYKNGKFVDMIMMAILKEEFTLGNREEEWAFSKQVILYDNPYSDKNEFAFTAFDVDVANTWRELSDSLVIIAENADGEMFTYAPTYSNLPTPLYTGALNLYSLITDFWNWDRPYDNGEIVDAPESLAGPVTFHQIRDNSTEIKMPVYDPALLNFEKYLITSFDNLKVDEISVNLETSGAIIKASK